jgi:hypothetical protein
MSRVIAVSAFSKSLAFRAFWVSMETVLMFSCMEIVTAPTNNDSMMMAETMMKLTKYNETQN